MASRRLMAWLFFSILNRFIYRENRVPYYQRLYQKDDGKRLWNKVSPRRQLRSKMGGGRAWKFDLSWCAISFERAMKRAQISITKLLLNNQPRRRPAANTCCTHTMLCSTPALPVSSISLLQYRLCTYWHVQRKHVYDGSTAFRMPPLQLSGFCGPKQAFSSQA